MRRLTTFLLLLAGVLAAATTDELNQLAGASIFGRGELWKEAPEALGKRLKVAFRSDGGSDRRILSAYVKKALVKYGRLNVVTLEELAASCL